MNTQNKILQYHQFIRNIPKENLDNLNMKFFNLTVIEIIIIKLLYSYNLNDEQ
jgi:hypothetical protein